MASPGGAAEGAVGAGTRVGDPVGEWRRRAMNVWTLVFVAISAVPSFTFAMTSEFPAWQRGVIGAAWLLAVAAAVLRRWPVWARLLLWMTHAYVAAIVGIARDEVGLNLALGLTSGPIGVTVLWGAAPGLVVAVLNLALYIASLWAADLGWLHEPVLSTGYAGLYSARAVAEVVPKLLLLVWFGHFLTGAVRREGETSARLREASAHLAREAAERLAAQRAAIASGERERERIGRDLHDGVCQDLSALLLRCSIAQRSLARQGISEAAVLDGVVEDLGDIMGDVRGLSRQLVPGTLEAADLVRAFEDLASSAAGSEVAVTAHLPSVPPAFSGGAGLHLFRIAQEAVRNALQHAEASRVDITLADEPDGVVLRVDDDGRGLSDAQGCPGLGLRTMAWRAEVAGGTLTVGARPGGGTRVECRLRPDSGRVEERVGEAVNG